MERINVFENGIYMTLEITDKDQLKLLHFGAEPFDESKIKAKDYDNAFNLTEISLSGFDRPYERHGIKYIVTAPGYRMKYHDRKDYRNDLGRVLEFVTRDEETDVFVTVKIQFYDGISVARFVNEVENRGAEEQTLEYVSLFNYTGIEKEGLLPRDEKMLVKVPHNSWQREMDWQTYTLPQLVWVSLRKPASSAPQRLQTSPTRATGQPRNTCLWDISRTPRQAPHSFFR